jgi:hypothetical protein
MNAQEIIALAVEEEMMKHSLFYAGKRCNCGLWKMPRGEKAFGTMQLQHARHVAQVVAQRLVAGELRHAQAA